MFNKGKPLLFLDHKVRGQGLRKLKLSVLAGERSWRTLHNL